MTMMNTSKKAPANPLLKSHYKPSETSNFKSNDHLLNQMLNSKVPQFARRGVSEFSDNSRHSYFSRKNGELGSIFGGFRNKYG